MWVWVEKRRDPRLRSFQSEVEEDPARDIDRMAREVRAAIKKASPESATRRRVTHWDK